MKYDFFAFINYDSLSPQPAVLYDLGVEIREKDAYYFDNSNRTNYNGFIFQYTISGHGMYEDESGVHNIERDMAFITCVPNDCKYYTTNGKNKKWEFIYIHFDGILARQISDEIVKISGNKLTFSYGNPVIKMLLNEYELLCNGKQYKKYEAGVFIYQFLTCLLREITTPDVVEDKIKILTEWINENYECDISVSDLSEKVGVTPSYLSRLFYKQMGVKPSEYITNVRLQRSMQLLTTTDLEITDIALMCGFSNGNYFSKVFRKRLGISPSDYRNTH